MIISIIILMGAGAWYVKKLVTDKIYAKLSEVIASPEVQKEIEAVINSEAAVKVLQDPSLKVPEDLQNLAKGLQQQTGSVSPQQEKKDAPAAVNGSEKSSAPANIAETYQRAVIHLPEEHRPLQKNLRINPQLLQKRRKFKLVPKRLTMQ